MKKTYILIALACIAIYSCTKHTTTYNTIDNSDTSAAAGFSLKGISDLEMQSRDSIFIPLMVEWADGAERKVTLSVSGLPANVTGTFMPAGGYNFSTTLKLVAKKAALGNSDFHINVSDSAGIIKAYHVTLTIKPKLMCMEEIVGSYMGDYACTSDTDSVAVFIFPTGGGPNNNQIAITNLIPFGFTSVQATIACEGQTIAIQNQQTGPFTIWGSGNFSIDSTVTINYKYFDGSDTNSCIARLKRQ